MMIEDHTQGILIEEGFRVALKLISILESRKKPEEHPDYIELKERLHRIKEILHE